MNLSRARRRWRRWDRYLTYLDRLDKDTVAPPGAIRACERLLEHRYRNLERRSRAACSLVDAAFEASVARTRKGGLR